MRLDPGQRLATFAGILLLAFLVANAFVSERNLQDIIAASNASRHTRQVLTGLDGVWSAVQDAERGQRGYLLTGDDDYLQPYRHAPQVLHDRLANLNELIVDPTQRKRFSQLSTLIDSKLAEVKMTIDLAKSGHRSEAVAVVRQDVGLKWTEQILKVRTEMETDEQSVLDARLSSLASSWQRARATNLVATVLGVALLTFLAFAFTRQYKQRKELLAQESRLEARFREMTDSLPLIVWSYSTHGEVVLANRFFFEFTGSPTDRDLTETMGGAIHPDDLSKLGDLWQMAHDGRSDFTIDIRYRRRDGDYRWFETRCVPFHGKSGIEGWFGSAIDVHDERVEQERLARAVAIRTNELMEANRELEGFTYSVSHDLRAPLRAIASTSHILVEDFGAQLPAPGKDLLWRQAAAASKLGRLIDDLLQLARLSRHELTREPLEISLLAAEIVDLLKPKDQSNFTFVVQPGLRASGDARLVRLALENLIGNAIKFSPSGGRIEFGERDTPRGHAFFVSDQGVGFDMAYAGKLFKPFERLVTEAQFPGTGIGLTNVQRVVERHGGQIWAESELGKGATFYFTLGPGPR